MINSELLQLILVVTRFTKLRVLRRQPTDSNDQQTSATETSGVSTKSTTTRMPNGDVEVNIRVKIPKDAQFSINGNAGSPTETVMRGLVDNINQKGGTKKKRPRRKKQTRRKKA